MLDAAVVAKCGDPVKQSGIEEFVVENTHFSDKVVSKTNPKYPEHAIPDLDVVPTPEQSD